MDAFTPSPWWPHRRGQKKCRAGMYTPHDTLICNTAAKTPCQMREDKGIITGWYGIFRCVGGQFTRAGPQVLQAPGDCRIILDLLTLFYLAPGEMTSPIL